MNSILSMNQRCLLIADDLTGGADAGAQFAKMGLNTILISLKMDAQIDFSKYARPDVLVINTHSRGLVPESACLLISNLLKDYQEALFPIIYKKIDSTLRGNIGYEIDAILKGTNAPLCFLAPSYPEQNRILVGGIMMVGEQPLSLTEAAKDTASPVQESHVYKLLEQQSYNRIGRIDLTHVASSFEQLKKAVEGEEKKGNKIIIFDAINRQNLTNIADVAFSMERKPLFAGSAGLAEEVAEKLIPSKERKISQPNQKIKPIQHIFIIGGSLSSVTHVQMKRVEQKKNISSFQLSKSFLMSNHGSREKQENNLSSTIGTSLAQGHAILKTYPKRLSSKESKGTPIHLEISKTLGQIALSALEESKVNAHQLALILTGGDTALSVLDFLQAEGIEIEGELLEGIVKGNLIGGNWDGLTVFTKAGAFGKENALEKVVDMLETGSPLTKEE